MGEIKYLPDGGVALVVGEAEARATSSDGGRTTEEVPMSLVARLATEEIETAQLLDERPTYDPETATWVQAGGEPTEIVAGTTPSGATDAEVIATRGDAQTAEQLQAEIDALEARKAALGTAASEDTSPERADDATAEPGARPGPGPAGPTL